MPQQRFQRFDFKSYYLLVLIKLQFVGYRPTAIKLLFCFLLFTALLYLCASMVPFLTQDFTVDLSVHFTWESNEIANLMEQHDIQFEFLDLDAQNMDIVWVPDIYFPNEKKAEVHKIMMSNKMLRIYKSGLVSYIIR